LLHRLAKQLLFIVKACGIPVIPFLFLFFFLFLFSLFIYFLSRSALSLLPTTYSSSSSSRARTLSCNHSYALSAAPHAWPGEPATQHHGGAAHLPAGVRRLHSSLRGRAACTRPCEGAPPALIATRPCHRPTPRARRMRLSPRGRAVVPSRVPLQGQGRPWLCVGATSARRSRWELVFLAPLLSPRLSQRDFESLSMGAISF
jgi:hypothetical protein